MAVILWTMGLYLLIQGCLSSAGDPETGCKSWDVKGNNACCKECHPGNRLVEECGPNPKDLCTPCESNTYARNSKEERCWRCKQCLGDQFVKEKCTSSSDTVCGCKEGFRCGDESCSFCVRQCGIGEEPTDKRTCRPCPYGSFNDQIHEKCKPWSIKCPKPGQVIVAKANHISDIKCDSDVSPSASPSPSPSPLPPPSSVVTNMADDNWSVQLSLIPTIFLTAIIIICMIIIVAVKTRRKGDKEKKTKKETIITPIIRTPTDDPETLIAIECSFHEAQQEQGSSSESLASKDSTHQLIV